MKVFVFTLLMTLISCVEQDATQFNNVKNASPLDNDELVPIIEINSEETQPTSIPNEEDQKEDLYICMEIPNKQECDLESNCQSVLNENEQFIGCVVTPIDSNSSQEENEEIVEVIEEESTPVENQQNKEETETQNSEEQKPEVVINKEIDETVEEIVCNKNQILICHVPYGNPSKKQTKCVGKNGWDNGISNINNIGSSLNYLGRCLYEEDQEIESIDSHMYEI